jgi:hypothetical protein
MNKYTNKTGKTTLNGEVPKLSKHDSKSKMKKKLKH